MKRYLCPVSAACLRNPEAEALVFGERRWSYRALDQEVSRAAAWLRARGVGPGDRIALSSWNRPEVVFGFHAAARLGATWVPINARLTPGEQAALISRLQPVKVLADPELSAMTNSPESASAPAGSAEREREDSPEAVRAILFTSGTTGKPKGAELTFANFDACARANAKNLGGGAEQRWLGILPLFHVGGLVMAHRCAVYGATLVLHPRYEAEAAARSLREERITHASFVATALRWLLEQGGEKAPPTLRALLIGGGPVPRELMVRARERGYPVLKTWGLTESCSQASTERPAEADGATAGPPLEGTQVRVVEGELQIRGPTVMRGYFKDPAATAKVLHDGWLRTGDLGEVDARGRIRVHSRRTDLIVSGGENIYPAEVEAVLAAHPSVVEAAVFALEDETWGQIPVALIVRARGASATELPAFCREKLAGFKVPRRFIEVGALPRTANGKVDRGRLRALAGNEAGFKQSADAVKEHDQHV